MNQPQNIYQKILEHSSDAIFILDMEGNLVKYSQKTQQLLGYTDKEMQELQIFDWDHNITLVEFRDMADSLDGQLLQVERTHTKKDGTHYLASITASKIHHDDKTYVYASVRDITNEKELLKKYQESEQRWKFAIEGNGDGLWDWNLQTNEVYFSPRWKTMIGFGDDEVENHLKEWEKRVYSSDLPKVYKDLQKCLDGKTQFYQNEHRMQCKDGSYKWILDRGVIIQRDQEGNPVRMIGTHRDIDNTKKLNEEIKQLKDRFENMFQNHDAIMLLIDPKSFEIIDANKSAVEFYGYSYKELLSMKIDQINCLNKEEIQRKIEQSNTLSLNNFEFPHKLKNGTIRTVEVHSTPIVTEKGELLFSIIKDITKEKMIEQELYARVQEFETIFNYAGDGIVVIDLNGNFMKFNQTFLELTGYTPKELLGKNCNDLTAPEDREKNINGMQQAILTGHVENFEKDCIVKHNRRITVHTSISLLPDKKSLLLILKDTSAIKLLEEQSKLASMGEMIGNIAHQWRQPLSVITTSASGLKMEAEFGVKITKEHIRKFSNLIVQQAEYLSKTIDSFRDFLKGDKNYEVITIQEVLENTFNLVDATIKNNYITLVKDIDGELFLNGSINELSEAFINIINNAKDVLKQNVQNQNERFIFISAKPHGRRYIEILIKDNGGGINEEIIDRIFEPYFTSKHQSLGTGLGLSMAETIIRVRHNGVISASNEEIIFEGKKYFGASFKIHLPLHSF